METFEVDITDKKAKALLKQLEALGIITLRSKKVRTLGQVIEEMRAKAKAPLTQAEVLDEIKAHRRSKRRHAAARKPQARS